MSYKSSNQELKSDKVQYKGENLDSSPVNNVSTFDENFSKYRGNINAFIKFLYRRKFYI